MSGKWKKKSGFLSNITFWYRGANCGFAAGRKQERAGPETAGRGKERASPETVNRKQERAGPGRPAANTKRSAADVDRSLHVPCRQFQPLPMRMYLSEGSVLWPGPVRVKSV